MASESKAEAATTMSGAGTLPADPLATEVTSTFDASKLDAALRADNYAEVFTTLRDCMDNRRDRRAADWIVNNSLRGHMVALYMLQRNRVKYTDAVMSTMELQLALESAIIAVVRAHEDAAACVLALGEDRDDSAVAFINKLRYWWSKHGDPKTWPSPATIMGNATRENRMRRMVTDSTAADAPQPTWLLGFSYSKLLPSWAVDFVNPVAGKSSACRTNHNVDVIRAGVRTALTTRFSAPDATWEQVWSITPREARSEVKLATKTA